MSGKLNFVPGIGKYYSFVHPEWFEARAAEAELIANETIWPLAHVFRTHEHLELLIRGLKRLHIGID